MYIVLIAVVVIASLFMCLIVLIQNSKGGGLASAYASSNQIMGVRKTTDFLEKATWTLAAVMVVLSVAAAYALPHNSVADSGIITEQALQELQTNPTTIPGFDTTLPATTVPGDSAE